MNKKVIAVAIAAAIAAPGAFAQATMYGRFHASVDAIDNESNNKDNYELTSRSSRIGVKGSEDLGNGLKAIYQLELAVNVDGGDNDQVGSDSGVSTPRNTFIGLAGDWGTLILGRHDTAAKVAYLGAGTEVLSHSVLDLNTNRSVVDQSQRLANPIGVLHHFRANNQIMYVSPDFGGFTFAGSIIPGEDSEIGDDDRDGIADHWTVGGIYNGYGLKASVGYAEYNSGNAGDIDQEVLQAGASYTFSGFTLGGHYETTDNRDFVDGDDYDAWAVVGKYAFGNNAISAVYTDSELDFDAGGENETDGWGVAAEHNFSKRTKVYAAYADGEVDNPGSANDDDNDVFSLGMIHKF